MAQQTGIRTFLLSKSLCHVGVGNIINLVSARSKQNRIHDAGHVTRNAAAAFRVSTMMGMRGNSAAALKLGVAVRAHQVRLIAKLYRSQVRSCIVSVRIVTGSAAYLSLPETLRPLQSFHDEGGLTKAPVLVKTDP